jgi:hypothetical protein
MPRKYFEDFCFHKNKKIEFFSYYTSIGNSRITVLSQWSSNCEITFLARINALPNSFLYDYKTGWIIKLN